MLASYAKSRSAAFVFTVFVAFSFGAHAQSGSFTSINGTVVDSSGAVVPNAAVEVRNPVSGFSRSAVTDAAGKFVIPNVPFNPYHVTVTGKGFAPYAGDVDVRSTVPV
ncbi:MAG TPA: carboxypeptidase-like regulatory domain-containing protein, partial [Terriglobales bacterium]|nr:carboxypeptidase-like regulatory domain-containing protein [Terriglobales bacterium]